MSDKKKSSKKADTKKAKSASTESKVKFALTAPGAGEVFVAGDFNNWDARSIPLKKDKHGSWKTTVYLQPGRYEYKYVIDGSWFHEVPSAELTVNSFGTYNIVLDVK